MGRERHTTRVRARWAASASESVSEETGSPSDEDRMRVEKDGTDGVYAQVLGIQTWCVEGWQG
jgi:hypothetical protein